MLAGSLSDADHGGLIIGMIKSEFCRSPCGFIKGALKAIGTPGLFAGSILQLSVGLRPTW